MPGDLVPYHPSSNLDVFHDNFIVPSNWKSCGPAIYISGAPGLSQVQPVAVALTDTDLSLCGHQGPIWSLQISYIKDVKVEELKGVSFPINTPSGVVQMVPPKAMGFSVTYDLTPNGMVGRVEIYTLSPNAAHEWVTDIRTAIYRYAESNFGNPDRKNT